MSVSIKVAGQWRNAIPKVKVAGAWRDLSQAYVKVGGQWRELLELGGWDLTPYRYTEASYDNKNFNVGAQDGAMLGLFFKPDGTKMYIVGAGTDNIYQYTLSTAWDVGTASYDSVSFNVDGQDFTPNGLFFKPDGTKMYVTGAFGDNVYQYTLSTAWDLSTASYDSVSFDILSQSSEPNGLFFKDDGTKMYVITLGTNDEIYQYSLSTAWDISTASYDNVSLNVSTEDISPSGITFKDDGTKIFISGNDTNSIYQYSLSIAWDLSTASYNSVSFNLSNQVSGADDLFLKPDGTKIYVLDGGTNDSVYQYTLESPWTLAGNTIDIYDHVRFDGSSITSEGIGRSVFFKSDGTKMYALGSSNDTIFQYTLSTAWDVTTSTYDSVSFNVNAQASTPLGIFFKSDGTKLYVVDIDTDSVYQYTLSTPWDLSTASYDSVSFSVASEETTPTGISFKPDGSKMYVVGVDNDNVHQYTLSTPWEVGTASYDNISFSVSGQTATSDVFFSSDGSKMYGVSNGTDSIHQYTLSTPWDLSTASYDNVSFDVSAYDTIPDGVFFRDDGSKMYFIGFSFGEVYQFDLSIAWKIKKNYNFDVSAQSITSQDVVFKPDGTKVFQLDYDGSINQYSLATAWDVTTASFISTLDISANTTQASGIFFKPDGTKLFVSTQDNDTILEYSLSTAWDATTESFVQSFSVATQEDTPSCVFFKDDGTKMYITGNTNDTVYQYTLSTPWDLSTASYDSVSFSSTIDLPRGIFFKDDGSKMFLIDNDTNFIYQYTLSTEWDVSTVSYDNVRYYVGGESTQHQGLFFGDGGSKLYIIGNADNKIFQYTLIDVE